MKANELIISEDVNTHLTHLEDLALFQGKQGAENAIAFLRNLSDLAKTSSPKKYNVTIKWDGSPAIFAGIDPSDGKFFVGTKSVFNKNAKLNKSESDIDANHQDQKEDGDKADLRLKLKKAFNGLSQLGIKNVLQGDLLFTKNSLKTIQHNGESYLAFKPNTITYAVPSNSELAQKIQQAEVGVVFHTSYSGSSLESMNASFDVDLSGLNKVDSVWYDDAYIKDFTGIVNLTTGEYQAIKNSIDDANTYLKQAGDIFSWFDTMGITGKKLRELIHMNHNKMVRAGAIEQDPARFFDGFANDYEQRIEDEIAKLKTGREGPAGQRKLVNLENFKKAYFSNRKNIEAWYSLWLKLIGIKNKLYQKLRNIKAIDAFDQNGDSYTVRDQEGFVAVDHIGKAVKVIDRLDFSRKNFAKENIQLVNDLTESRAFRSRQDIGKHTAEQIGELIYAYCLALVTLKNEFKYKKIARQYASRTMSYNNFDYFRTNGTDLYLLVHSLIGTGSIVQFNNQNSSQAFVDRLSKNKFTLLDFLNYIEITEVDHSLCNRLLVKLEKQFKINSFQAKKIRRELSVYDLLKMKDKANIVNLVMNEIRQFAPRSELYTPLQNMFRERKLSNDDTVKQRKLRKNVGAGAL
tara:strand:- start:12175 stop:14067 length:1893 start_codon:yes stop_codon:yes gene_type:complete